MSWQPQPRGPVTIGQFNAWFAKQEELTAHAAANAGRDAGSRGWHERCFHHPSQHSQDALVQAEPSASLTPNYIETLLAARRPRSRFASTRLLQPPPPRALLYLLLRHSMLLEYAVAAASRLLINRGLLQPAQRREPELVDLPLGPSMLTVWRQMATKITVQGVAGADRGREIPARLHAVRRTRPGTRTRN